MSGKRERQATAVKNINIKSCKLDSEEMLQTPWSKHEENQAIQNYVYVHCMFILHMGQRQTGYDQCCPSVLEYSLKSEQLAQGGKGLATKQSNTLLRAFDIIGKQVRFPYAFPEIQ